MKDIPADSLIKNYFPVDYIDSFSKVMVTGQALTPEDFRNLAFSRFPKWIGWLMNFRNAIVKPLGLDTATRFTDMVLDKNLHEEILGMPDKHLDFHVSSNHSIFRLDTHLNLTYLCAVTFNNNDYGKRKSKLPGGI